VHAFATDPARGFFILAFLGVVILGALGLYAWRAPSLDSQAGFKANSRETFLLLNNVLLVIAAALVFIGTLAPLVVEVFEAGKISVGAPWFEVAFAIPMIPLLFLIGLGMHTAWRQTPDGVFSRKLKWAALLALVAGIFVPGILYERFGLMVGVGVAAAVWVMAASLIDPYRAWRRSEGTSGLTRASVGMNVAHFGVGLFTLGVTVVLAYSIETDRALRPGQAIDVGHYHYELRELRNVEGPNYSAIEGVVEIRRDGEYVGEVRPQKRQYLVQKSPMTEAGILALWNRDLFVALGDPLGNDSWSVRVQYKPLIRFIWLGCLIMALGGLIAATDRRYRVKSKAREPAVGAEVSA
jgi:cytochrome c-type biogenesis protein CcmF